MRAEPICPRCGGTLHPPGLWSSAWVCDLHGEVAPLQPVPPPTIDVIGGIAAKSAVPLWSPWPLPKGWLVTGIAHAGDERTGPRAVAVACSGPAPLGGMGEAVLVAEEPGIGLGAHYAGLPGPDPGMLGDGTAPHAKVHAAGHPTPLWWVESAPDRAVYVGEALGCWLWAVLWPGEAAGPLLLEDLILSDLREHGAELELLPLGAQSPRIEP
jgi:hypothetical protein